MTDTINESISVYVRIRPRLSGEVEQDIDCIIPSLDSNESLQYINGSKKSSFKFTSYFSSRYLLFRLLLCVYGLTSARWNAELYKKKFLYQQ